MRTADRTLRGVSMVAENSEWGFCHTICEAEAVISIQPTMIAMAPCAGPMWRNLGVVQSLRHGRLDAVHVF